MSVLKFTYTEQKIKKIRACQCMGEESSVQHAVIGVAEFGTEGTGLDVKNILEKCRICCSHTIVKVVIFLTHLT